MILPVLDVDESSWFDKQGVKTNLNISSVALLSDEKFYGFLHEEDANGIRWYQKDTLRAPIVIDNEEGEVKGLIVLRVRDTNVKPVVSNEAVKFKIDVKVAGSLIEMSQETTEKEIIKSVKEKIKEDLRRTYEKGLELDGDVYSFSYHLFRENPNKWKQLTVNEALHLNEDSLEDINVEVYLRDAGEKRLSQ
ncbi:Ger(x)C family spore germination C-terminal domain-containing protein [Piscibacillus salipiscarius]|uniref:Ger(x)C family spore germination C-terminal domain-containing protein n=1 Tax=Piscibacillus salipiscarius TaxID=299480 RepID=UPI0006D28158|nr:Ger(x)C family spore germination C-terminal domain-containing protein [Piscibacillus salipiscarius]